MIDLAIFPIFFVLSATGIAALIVASPSLFAIIKWINRSAGSMLLFAGAKVALIEGS